MQSLIDIVTLISQGKIVTSSNIDPANDYVAIQKFVPNNRKLKGDNKAYQTFAVPLSELLGGGSTTPITLGVIPVGTGPSIADGTWSFVGNNLVPLTTGSDIGTDTLRAGTIYSGPVHTKIINGIGSYWGTDDQTIEIRKTGSIYTDSGMIFHSPYSPETYSGMFTEAGGEVLSLGINVDQIDATFDITRYGGLFRLDSRAGSPYFNVIRRDLSGNFIDDLIINGDGNVSIGAPTSLNNRLRVRGADATAANFAMRLEDVATNPILVARNDKLVGINLANPSYNLDVFGSLQTGYSASNRVLHNGSIFHAKINDNNWIGVNRDGLGITEMWASGATLMYNTTTTSSISLSATEYTTFRENTSLVFRRTDNTAYAYWDSTNYKLKIGSLGLIPTFATSAIHIENMPGYAQLRLAATYTPSASADANGNTGDFAWDDSYVYVKVSTGWKRASLNAF